VAPKLQSLVPGTDVTGEITLAMARPMVTI